MSWEEREILLVVKTYPTRSKKYENTVCTAGILEDTNEWVRLYPLRMEKVIEKKLKKFVRFKAKIMKDTSDYLSRKESYKIRDSSIEIIDDSLTITSNKDVWDERTKILKKVSFKSVEELKEKFSLDRTSLGIIKPKINSIKFNIKKPINEIRIEKEISTQYDLFGGKQKKVDKIEKAFSYKFQCNDEKCTKHDIICEDWELFQAFRDWQKKYPNEKVFVKKLREKFNDWMINRDLYFIMGTHWRFNTWIIIGLYYPPKKEKEDKYSSILVI